MDSAVSALSDGEELLNTRDEQSGYAPASSVSGEDRSSSNYTAPCLSALRKRALDGM